jgi:hypothetical protein
MHRCFHVTAPRCRVAFIVGCAFMMLPGSGRAEDSLLTEWFARVSQTQAEQPHWITPLVTVTPRLEQEWRSDLVSQSQPRGVSTLNYGNGKGLDRFRPIAVLS